MKKFIIIFLLYNLQSFKQEFKLNGKYEMQYEDKFNFQNGIIIFNDSIYVRYLSNGKSITGHIFYQKFNVTLKDDDSYLQMNFLKREIQRDTIFFGTKNLNDKSNNSELTINSAKLIKIN